MYVGGEYSCGSLLALLEIRVKNKENDHRKFSIKIEQLKQDSIKPV